MPAVTHSIQCSGCPRKFEMTLQTISTRPKCMFCGGSLTIPEVLLAEALKAAAPVVKRTAINTECFVCARSIVIKPEAFGRTTKCSYCTAPMKVSTDGTLSTPPFPGRLIVEEHIAAETSCASCRQTKLQLQPGPGIQVRCAECGASADIGTEVLSHYFPIARPGDALLTDFAHMALQARWSQRTVTLTEASLVLADIAVLDEWASKTPRQLSPFPVEETAEIIQYAIACNSSAMNMRQDDGLMLVFPKRSQNDSRSLDGGAITTGMAVSLAAARPGFHGLMPMRLASNQNQPKEMQGDPATCLFVVPYQDGCELMVLVRDGNGDLAEAPRGLKEQINGAVRGAMPTSARQYLAFKAIFGIWATGEMLYGATAAGINKRLVSLGGTLRDSAAKLGPALIPVQALEL